MENGFDKLSRGSFTLYIHKDFRGDIGLGSRKAGSLQTCGSSTAGVRNDTFEQALLAGGKELHERYHPLSVRSSKSASVCKFGVRFGDVEKVVYLKEYFCRSVWDFGKHLFRSSRAKRALKAGLMLAENGFEGPTVIAIGHRKFAFFTTRSFVATLEVENARSVYQLVSAAEPLRERRSFIKVLGRTIGRMHAEGIFHGDLRPGNVLARKEQGKWHIFFLDNERTKKFRRLPARLRLKNLVQINMFEQWEVSNTDRMRFFKEYWAESKEAGLEKAVLMRKIIKRTGRRLRKKMKSGKERV